MNNQLKTIGVSPKAALAFLFPFLTTLAAAAGSWVVTGEFNEAEVRVALAGLIASGVAGIGAYVGKPGPVTHDDLEIPGEFDEPGAPVVPPGLQT